MGDAPRIPLVAILAGGRGLRMGADKVGLPLDGIPLIERVWARVAPVAAQVVSVGGADRLGHLGVPAVPDRYPGADSLGGLATALEWGVEALGPGASVLCVACDLPLLEPRLLLHLHSLSPGWDAVVPRVEAGHEPLCAVYGAPCLEPIREQILRGNLRIRDVFSKVRTREVPEDELRRFDPELRSFLNVNRPGDLEMARRFLAGAA